MSDFKYINGDVEFSNIKNTGITTSQKISSSKYNVDENGNIIKPNKIINAIDIDWNNAKIKGIEKNISTTADLLQTIANINKGQSTQTVSTSVIIGANGNWWIDNVDTGIPATGQNGLTPYIKDNAWYIGNIKIIDISDANNGLTPYIKNNTWWIGNTDTGISAVGTAGNSPYIGEDGYWYINGVKTEYNANNMPGTEGQTPYIKDGYWWIGNYNTGVIATATNLTSSIITIGDNGHWFINGIDTGLDATKTIYVNGGDGNSLPIYDSETELRLREENSLPNKYIALGDDYNLPHNTSLITNLLNVISQLQTEVTKLKNTFTRGIYSYNNEATFMSTSLSNYGDINAEEPLWSIDERELAEVGDLNFDLDISKIFIDDNSILANNEDQRMFLYLTAESSNIEITLNDADAVNNSYTFNFNNYVTCDKCNIMLIISRLPNDKNYPANYIYFTITDYESNIILVSGYLNNNKELIDSQYDLSSRYYIYKVDMHEADPSKFNVYTDNKALGNEVIPTIPDEDEDSYRVAHIAIRSCKNYATIEKISKQLVNNEFVFDEKTEQLYFKTKGKIIKIGSASSGGEEPGDWGDDDNTMTNQEILKALAEQGIISIKFKQSYDDMDELYDPSNIVSYDLNNIGSVKFIHEETGKVFEFKTNENGELESKLIDESGTIASYLNGSTLRDDYTSVRGVIGQVGELLYSRANNGTSSLAINKDHILYADRIKIGAVYAPVNTDIIHGCSHAYVELENTSDIDYNLTGCSLHFIHPSSDNQYYVDSQIKLNGIIKGGSTYLIRGKQYTTFKDPNCFIKVKSYDQEWYENKQLIDFSINKEKIGTHDPAYIFILMYDNIDSESNMYKLANDSSINTDSTHDYLGTTSTENTNNGKLVISKGIANAAGETGSNSTNSSYVYAKGLIDGIAINSVRYGIPAKGLYTATSNCLYKNTFELDPAKQAYNAMTKHDSSRQRWQNNATDYMYVGLDKPIIEFMKSEETYPVEYFTPKASYENKNVCSDKTKFNHEKPNAVSVSFGENIYKTRCFNWVSGSKADEYVWIYDSSNNLIGQFESYKVVSDNSKFDTYNDNKSNASKYPLRKEYPMDVNNIIYCDYRENKVYDQSRKDKNGNYLDVTYPEYALSNRCCGLFAATNDFFTSHKCVIDVVINPVLEKTTYYYIVGQADKTGKNPDLNHTSEKRSFTLYPESYKPVIYQITDQQGFHWVEYQVWAAAAIKVNEKIMVDMQNDNIIPIIINTGDATQSGSRVNEWLDYFNAGDVLFNHFEQNNIVGNNDLNGTDIQFLGTGDDTGKSNGYYYYIFNCCDANNFYSDSDGDHYPIVNGVYMPSLYYIQSNNTRIVLCNSEFTIVNCRDWFNLNYNGAPVNIFTGFTNVAGLKEYAANKTKAEGATFDKFTPVYNLLYHAFEKSENGNRRSIAVCHEMPFTVITASSVAESKSIINLFRSINTNGSSLVGSHMNQINSNDNESGVYWFSRLMESQGVKLCIGGHKHTYTSTYPLRENYKYNITYNKSTGSYDTNSNGYWNSKNDGPMTMGPSLEFESRTSDEAVKVLWSWIPEHSGEGSSYTSEYQWAQESAGKHYGDLADEFINWSKLPLTYRDNSFAMPGAGNFYPATIISEDAYYDKAVIYIMCQATGYKLTSNKELPTPFQKFSRLVPQTNPGTSSDTPDNNQKFPMFMIYNINESTNKCNIKLARVANIFDSKYKFTQQAYDKKNAMKFDWLIDKSYWTSEAINKDNIVILSKYDGYDSTNDKSDEKLNMYDNYGLWLNNIEHEMIPDISL